MADATADLRTVTIKMHLDTAASLLESPPVSGEEAGWVARRHADAEWHILRARLLMARQEAGIDG